MVELILYERARNALAEAHRVDEAKDIIDKSAAMKVYAKQAQDLQLMRHATEINLRAKRRAGELLKEMRDKGERSSPGDVVPSSLQHDDGTTKKPTLKDLGITPDQSSQWQKLAAMPEEKFEAHIEIQNDKQLKKEEQERKKQEKEAEKQRLQREKEEYHRRIDESGIPDSLKEQLKGRRVPPHIDAYVSAFTNRVEKSEGTLEDIMYHWEHISAFDRRKLALALYRIGHYYITCAEKLRDKEHIPNFAKLTIVNPVED